MVNQFLGNFEEEFSHFDTTYLKARRVAHRKGSKMLEGIKETENEQDNVDISDM